MLPKSYLSISQIQCYLRCPAQYYFRYVRGIQTPPNRALTIGKVVHAANEANYKQKLNTGIDMELEDIRGITEMVFDQQAPITDWGEDDPGEAKDTALTLASLYHQKVAPAVQPKAVELRVTVEFENVPYSLLGFIDLIDSEGFIRDTKTTAKTPNEDEAGKSLQLTTYCLAYQCEYGHDPAGVKLDYLVATKTPRYVQLQGARTEAEIDRLLRLIGKVAGAIGAGHYYPNPTSFLCSEKACQHWQLCQAEF
jgi:putative RecB family exonuclease